LIFSPRRSLRTIFIDRLSLPVLIRLFALGKSLQTVWVFEPISHIQQRWFKLFRKLRLIRVEVLLVDSHVGHIQTETGESAYIHLIAEARSLTSKFHREQLTENPLIQEMGSLWDPHKVILYLEKQVEYSVRFECVRIGLVEWLMRISEEIEPDESALWIEHSEWFSYLEAHARSKGVRLLSYPHPLPLALIRSRMGRIWQMAWRGLKHFVKAVQNRLHRGRISSPEEDTRGTLASEQQSARFRIAIRYGHRDLSFDPDVRSEFFWLHDSGIPFTEVLLYDHINPDSLSDEKKAEIERIGVRLLGRVPGAGSWMPSLGMVAVLMRSILLLFLRTLLCILRGRWPGFFYLSKLSRLAVEYAYWLDFYAKNGVALSVDTLNARVSQILAMDSLNGVSVAFQYSAADINGISTMHSAGEDIQFVFSQVFDQLWRTLDAPVRSYVHTGVIFDRSISIATSSSRVAETRAQLMRHGAQFIVCFFDENSLDRWDLPFSNEDAARDYEYLLNWLLEDPTLGLVFKPKVSATIFQRISSVSHLIEAAERTGRCRFLTSDTIVGNIYPAEAALMADVCVGKLYGCTAALEARLAGVPTVMIDVDGLINHPGRFHPEHGIVFDEWDGLRTAIERYRTSPQDNPEFGDWSPWLNDLDPFQDGHASLRMGSFIRWTYEALKRGESKTQALEEAAQEFEQVWGNEHVTKGVML
jgi:hypothetical protein